MNIYCIGNDIEVGDNFSLQLIPFLSKEFPDVEVLRIDPTENFTPNTNDILIDSVVGIKQVSVFTDIDAFVTTKSVSVHDYDLGFHLQMLKKIHQLPIIHIIGVPLELHMEDMYVQIIRLIRNIISEMKIEV